MSTPNPEYVTLLMSMGFAEGSAKTALLRANNDINRAADLLSNGSEFLVTLLARFRWHLAFSHLDAFE
jgi:hypothetical protein